MNGLVTEVFQVYRMDNVLRAVSEEWRMAVNPACRAVLCTNFEGQRAAACVGPEKCSK